MPNISPNSPLLAILCLLLILCSTGFCSTPSQINTYTYILQADELSEDKSEAVEILRECNRELIIIDPFFSNDTRWTKNDIERIKSGLSGRIVVAYLSIGEAENYREYWQKSWNTTETAPAFLLEENPDWKGNFKVNYWDKSWQKIVFSEVNNIVAQGFDGIFIDIVDGFEYFENVGEDEYIDNRINAATGMSYRSDMIEFIKAIRNLLDSYSGSDYLIIPQNGTQLLESPLYQDLISMQAVEDLFTYGNKAQDSGHTSYILNFINSLINQGRTVLLTEYPTKKKYIKLATNSAKENNITLLVSPRSLDKLGKNPIK